MVDIDDLGERRPSNHTPTIALGVAGFLLLVVGALTYSDYVEGKYRREYDQKERDLLMRHGYVPYPAGQQPVAQGQPMTYNRAPDPRAEGGGSPNGQSSVGFQQPASASGGDGSQSAGGNGSQLARSADELGVESSLPEPADPEIESIRTSLDEVREQARRTEERYQAITGDVDRRAREAKTDTDAISSELPEFLREAVANPPGGNPSVQARLERLREQVRKAPSLAQVTSYNNDWGIVTFNAGAAQNVKKEQRFAVRRGSEILGWVRVDEVQPNQSIAVLVTRNRDSDTALKPEPGDDLIDFELF